ncbi:hypothetical protein LTR66_003916 [Elasticomyces elasticus]|nr:hypothetical protein LTR28_006572 [Elasticomyces elasticus]KAK4984107.1 hypothetical protein LTR50_006794 [Elasticomyces elasticus]KAK4996479.1 hypothetical protein LTR66_003916 [Elasticomyces elasticus]
MVFAKFILFFAILATSVFAAPSTALLEARDTILHCRNAALDYKANSLSLDSIKKQISEAPAEVGKSGYPHEFKNLGGLIFDQACDCQTLLEFPVSKNGKTYKYESKPKDNPGPFRGIATADGRIYCGTISHDGEKEKKIKKVTIPANPNVGFFHLCT